MATIETQFNLVDRMTTPLMNINSALETVVNQMQSVDNAMDMGFDSRAIDSARKSIDLAGIELDQMSTQIKENTLQQNKYNQSANNSLSILSKMNSLIGIMSLASIGYGFKTLGTTFISSAADLEATEAKFNTVFAGFTQQAQTIVDDFKMLTPATEASTRSMVSGIQDLLVPMGFARSEATNMTSEIMTLTGALTNFNSATHTAEDVASVFSSALVGEYDSLKALGVQLNVDIVKQHAVAMGLANTTSEVTAQQQALAMLELAYEQSGDALDAYNEDSLDTISNMGLLKASFIDTFAIIGQSMLPKVNELLIKVKDNMPTIERLLYAMADGFIFALDVAIVLFDEIMIGTRFIIDNWSNIAPIITQVSTALIVLSSVYKIVQTSILIATIAQNLFSSAIWSCPVTWIIAGFLLAIVVLYKAVDSMNEFANTSISATGIICGIVSLAVAFIGNLFVALWNLFVDGNIRTYNLFAMLGNFIGNVFNDPVSAVIRLFYNMFDIVLSIIQSCASAIDTIFGTNLANGLQSFRDTMNKGVDILVGEETIYFDYVTGDDYKLDRLNYGQSFEQGYDFGSNIEQTITGIFDMSSLDNVGDYITSLEFPEVPEYSSLSDLEYLDELNNASSFPEIPEEDLQYLRDIAEREVVNRFTTAQVKVDLGGVTNNVNNNNDLDGLIDYLASEVDSSLQKTANGVYA